MIDRQVGRYYTQADVAQEFGVHNSVVRRWLRDGLASAGREYYTDRGCVKSVMWFTEYEVDRLWEQYKREEMIFQDPNCIRAEDAAEMIGCAVNLVFRVAKRGDIRSYRTPYRDKRIVYYDRNDVWRFAKEWKTRRMEYKNYAHLRPNGKSNSLNGSQPTSPLMQAL